MGKLKNLGLAGALPLVLSPRRVLWNTNTHKNRNMKPVSLCLGNFWPTASKNKISPNISQLSVLRFLNFLATTVRPCSLVYCHRPYLYLPLYIHIYIYNSKKKVSSVPSDTGWIPFASSSHSCTAHHFLVRLCHGKHPAFPYPLGSVKLLWTLRFQHAMSAEFNHHHNQSVFYYLCYIFVIHYLHIA